MKLIGNVAQISNLLYRRFPTYGATRVIAGSPKCNSARRQIGNLRYLVGLCALLAFSPSDSLFAQPDATNPTPVRFLAVDIFVDSKDQPLAAYQLEFSVTNSLGKIVGIEGGEHAAFAEPPFYDPKAMQRERVIIAAFSTQPADTLPTGSTRVATIHLQVIEKAVPEFVLKLHTAADAGGRKLTVSAYLEEGRSR